jgi:hypothetical protein
MRTPTRSAAVAATSLEATPSSGSPDSKRRRFLFTLGLGGASVAVSTAASVSAVTAAADPSSVAADGYRETEHVRRYYRTAKL